MAHARARRGRFCVRTDEILQKTVVIRPILNYNVYVMNNCLEHCSLTAEDDVFYMFYMDNNHKAVWRVSLNDLNEESEMQMISETFDNSSDTWLMMLPDGALLTGSGNYKYYMRPMSFKEIDMEKNAIQWKDSICRNDDALFADSDLSAGTLNCEIRYLLDGNNMVCLNWNYEGDDVAIWYVPELDYAKGENIITVYAPDTKGKNGLYYPTCGQKDENTVYFVYMDEADRLTLVMIDKEGKTTQTIIE